MICRAWADDGCEHYDEDTGELKPEFVAQSEDIARRDAEAEAKYYESLLAEPGLEGPRDEFNNPVDR